MLPLERGVQLIVLRVKSEADSAVSGERVQLTLLPLERECS